MKCSYKDISDRIGEPLWWDEIGVPRYKVFFPESVCFPATSAALILVACQNCEREFQVALSGRDNELLEEAQNRTLKYGDPPDVACCNVGPTMNSVPLRLLQFWQMKESWQRKEELEGELRCDWIEPNWDRKRARELLREIGEQ